MAWDWVDVISKAAPVVAAVAAGVAAYSAYRSQQAARATADRAERAERRSLESEEADRRVRVRITAIQDIPKGAGPGPARHAKLFLIPPRNGDYCEITHCKVEMTRAHGFELRYDSTAITDRIGNDATLKPTIDLTKAEQQLNLSIHLYEFGNLGTTLTFSGFRQDDTRTRISFQATIPPHGEAGSVTIFD